MDQKFEAFPDIKKLGNAQLSITQKIHGSNAQIYIFPVYKTVVDLNGHPVETDEVDHMDLKCGSRTRWVAPGNDNYGFAEHVYAHKQEYIEKLGQGRHYGEWAGLGINSGEGLKDKVLVLFDYWKYPPERPLPPKTVIVPVLYEGKFDLSKIEEAMNDLKTNGSKLCPGFMRPEGVVVRIKGDRYKVVFTAEETQWKGGDPNAKKEKDDSAAKALEKYGHLLQPIRLEKLFSRDEAYLRDFPKSMPLVAAAYFEDLLKEGQVTGSEEEIKGIKKMLGSNLFKFIKEIADKQGISA